MLDGSQRVSRPVVAKLTDHHLGSFEKYTLPGSGPRRSDSVGQGLVLIQSILQVLCSVGWSPGALRPGALPFLVLGNQPFLANLSFSLREWLSKPAGRTNGIVLLNAGLTGQERVSMLALFHLITAKEPFPGVGEHCLCQPRLP